MIKKFIINCLISYHSLCYTLWWWVIYFLTCPLLYIKLVQIVVKIFLFLWTTCEEQTQFFIFQWFEKSSILIRFYPQTFLQNCRIFMDSKFKKMVMHLKGFKGSFFVIPHIFLSQGQWYNSHSLHHHHHHHCDFIHHHPPFIHNL